MNITPDIASVLRLASRLAAGAAICTCALSPFANADDAVSPTKPVCIRVDRIEHTRVLNNHQILFALYGGKSYINNLSSQCTTLMPDSGFAWSASSAFAYYCDNREVIHVLGSDQACLLGAFTPYAGPKNF